VAEVLEMLYVEFRILDELMTEAEPSISLITGIMSGFHCLTFLVADHVQVNRRDIARAIFHHAYQLHRSDFVDNKFRSIPVESKLPMAPRTPVGVTKPTLTKRLVAPIRSIPVTPDMGTLVAVVFRS
jgi:hypothetical protein